MSKEEIGLKILILDAVLYQLSRLEFSQEEGSIEIDVTEAIKKLQDARAVYTGWLKKQSHCDQVATLSRQRHQAARQHHQPLGGGATHVF